MNGFLNEIRRRNVHRVAIAYVTASWLLIQVVETLFPVFGLSDAAIRIAVILLAAGFIPAVVLAWIFEWTSAGIRRDEGIATATTAGQTRRFDRVIMALLALAVVYLVVDKFVIAPDKAPARVESIAVLAFDDLSPDEDQAWFAEGLSEELLNLLAGIPGLRVAGRTSAFSFRDKDATIPEIAAALDVAHIVEGSVRRFENRLRITVQLIEARTDTHVWSETYDREFGDIFDIQDEIARAVVDKLHLNLLGEPPKTRPTDPAAYALYLQARHLMNGNFSAEEQARAIRLLEQALAIDSAFPEATSVLARARWLGSYFGGWPQADIVPRVRKMIDEGLAASPGNGALLGWQAFLVMVIDNDLYASAVILEQAHESDPTSYELIQGTTAMAPLYGRPAIGARLGEYLVERDPLCMRCYVRLAEAYLANGDFQLAETAVRRALTLKPDEWSPNMFLGQALFFQERYAEALDVFEGLQARHETMTDEPYSGAPGHAETLQALGRDEEYRSLRERYLEYHEHEEYVGLVAQFYAWAGDNDRAFEWLDREDKVMTWGIRHHLTRPWYRKLHGDPRWQALLERYQMTQADFDAIDLTIRMPPDAR